MLPDYQEEITDHFTGHLSAFEWASIAAFAALVAATLYLSLLSALPL